MFGIDYIPGLVMGLREGLEAFLIIAIMLEYLNKTNKKSDKKYVFQGFGYGVLTSLVFGLLMGLISILIGASSDNIIKLWESIASLVALILITTFIFWMMKHRYTIVSDIHDKMAVTFSKTGIILLALVMVAREGAEIVLFVFASVNRLSYFSGTLTGVLLAGLLTFLIYKSLIKVNLKVLFNITLFYLILQAGFMVGYSIHELLSYFKAEAILDANLWVYTKLFDLSGTFIDHKESPLGIALYAGIGWYSKPEIIQFIAQYLYTGVLLFFFFKPRSNQQKSVIQE
ncbi:MAG: hydrogenase [Tenericutes bacterium HGW-Tenericutes-1]|jgi:high-affinity iron transporter|nr:MAG: hydrogenase [Tenericutes bacterium HGW-Tenericutes-1]